MQERSPATTQVSSHTLDMPVLCEYLQQHVKGFKGPATAKKFPGGQSNPTFLIEAASGQYVLRRQPPGKLLKSAHAVDREFRVQRALADTAVPVASVYHLCEDREIIGSMFYLMEYKEGQIFWDPALPQVNQDQRSLYYAEAIRILADLHQISPAAHELEDYGKPGNYFARQFNIWSKQYRASETRGIDAMENLMAWLEQHCPADDGTATLVHGDFRFDNIMFERGSPRGVAVLDWELSTLGHPLADLAYFCMCLRLPSTAYFKGLAHADRDALGIPHESSIVEQYCRLRGLSGIDQWHFYLAFSFFRLAAILQGVLKRALDGNASSDFAQQMGEMVEPLATMALEIIEQP